MSFSRRSCINFIDVVARAPHDHHRRVVSICIVYLCSFASSFMCLFDNDTQYKNMLSVHLVACKFLTKFWNFCAIHRNVYFSFAFSIFKGVAHWYLHLVEIDRDRVRTSSEKCADRKIMVNHVNALWSNMKFSRAASAIIFIFDRICLNENEMIFLCCWCFSTT